VTPVDLTPGEGFHLLEGGPCRVGVAICFESIFPYISRTLTASGAEVLCVITNDTWFGPTSAADQHAEMSTLRAVENRRYLLRGAATGVSCIIDPQGRVIDRLPIFRRGTVSAQVRSMRSLTFYTRHGEWFVYAVLGVIGLAAIRALCRRRGRKGCSSATEVRL
jgi:apolipoprotein N-acyltransferase